jgi:broad specificity phosphatase PhoE
VTILYLVRHGKIERGRPDIELANPPLSVRGHVEAEEVAVSLQSHPIVRVYSSPLRRAQETAAPVAAHFALPVIIEPRLRERMNYGDLPEQSREEFIALWERSSLERDFTPPAGDSSRGAGQRVEAFVRELYQELPTAEVMAASHGGTIADFLHNICPQAELERISPAFAAQPYAA